MQCFEPICVFTVLHLLTVNGVLILLNFVFLLLKERIS